MLPPEPKVFVFSDYYEAVFVQHQFQLQGCRAEVFGHAHQHMVWPTPSAGYRVYAFPADDSEEVGQRPDGPLEPGGFGQAVDRFFNVAVCLTPGLIGLAVLAALPLGRFYPSAFLAGLGGIVLWVGLTLLAGLAAAKFSAEMRDGMIIPWLLAFAYMGPLALLLAGFFYLIVPAPALDGDGGDPERDIDEEDG